MSTTVSDVVNVGADSKTANLLGSTQLEFMQYPANLLIAAVAGAAEEIRMTLAVGDELVIDDQRIPQEAALRLPQKDDFIFNSGARRGDRVVLTLRGVANTGGTDVGYTVKAVPFRG